jgi:hypothetical protein
MRRWVGLGVIADNLINIGRRLVPKLAWLHPAKEVESAEIS